MRRLDVIAQPPAPSGSFLCYGDLITFEVRSIEGCPTGGFLGPEDVNNLIHRIRQESQESTAQSFSAATNNTSSFDERLLSIRPSRGNYPPQNFYHFNIFQVVAGFGFEAAGEPVKYGSQIKLRLKSTGEVLRAQEKSAMLQLLTSKEFEMSSNKECNFRIMPRYDTRAEGDAVYFHDLILLRDFMDRSVFCTSSTKIILTKNRAQITGFYISQFAPNKELQQRCMLAGDIIQLYHKEERCFFMANTEYAARTPEGVTVCKQEEIVLPNASSYWQVELVAPGIRSPYIKGPLSNSTSVRLKHLATGKHLSVIDDRLTLGESTQDFSSNNSSSGSSGGNSNSSIFELRLNFDHNSPTYRDFLEMTNLTMGAGLRLYHTASKSYLTLRKDSTRDLFLFALSKTAYDKDVFQTIAVPPEQVDIVYQGKKYHLGLSSMLEAMDVSTVSTSVLKRLMQGAGSLVKALTREDGGYLSHDRNHFSDLEITVAYNTCFELGMAVILFQLADRGFHRVSQLAANASWSSSRLILWKEEEVLIAESYNALSMLLAKSKDSKRPPIPRDVVSLMVNHLKIMGSLGEVGQRLTALMPLTLLIDAMHDDMKEHQEEHGAVDILTPFDIERLLDTVEIAMQHAHQEVPDPLPWNLLARICNPLLNNDGQQQQGDDKHINKKVQVEICRQILGSPYATEQEAPGWSLFIYRTCLRHTPVSTKDLHTSVENHHSQRSSDRNHRPTSPHSGHHPVETGIDGRGGYNAEPVVKTEFLVCTSPFGQCRPSSREGAVFLPVRPPGVTREICNDDKWQQIIDFRNHTIAPTDGEGNALFTTRIPSMPSAAHGTVSANATDTASHTNDHNADNAHNANLEHEYHTHLANLLSQTRWKSIRDLTDKEIDLFRAMIDLLASVCAGRNIWTQRVVRRIFPVDHVLVLLESIQVATSTDHNRQHNHSQHYDHTDLGLRLLPLKTAALLLLHECYINSACITPIPASGKDAMREVDYSHQDNQHTWEEALMEECASKVFGLFSQVDFFDLALSKDMTAQDLDLCLRNLEHLDQVELNRVHQTSEPAELFKAQIDALKAEFLALPVDVDVTKQKVTILRQIQDKYRNELYRLCTYATNQRRQLQRIVEHFVTREAGEIWDHNIQTPILQLCCTDNRIYSAKNVSISTRLDDQRNLKHVSETSLCIDYFNTMLRVLRSLLLRQFFDPDYNHNKMLDACMVDSSLEGVADHNHNHHHHHHHPGNSHHATHTNHNHKHHLSSKSQLLLHPRSWSSTSGGASSSSTDDVSKGKLSVLREIAATFLRMMGSWPGDLSAIELSDDERAVEQCFQRIFGYIQDSMGLTEGVVGIKLQCCNLLAVCLDIMHVCTTKELRRIFDYMMEFVCINKKRAIALMNAQQVANNAKKVSEQDQAQAKIVKFLKNKMSKRRNLSDSELSRDELKTFRMKVWTELHVRVVRDPDMLWNEMLLFKKDTFHTLMQMVMHADPQLRAESLHLLYRINSHQSELTNYMMHEFEFEKKEDTVVLHYLKQQKFKLQRILIRFDRFFDALREVDHLRTVEASHKDERLLGHLLQMKKLLLSADDIKGGQGLIAFLFDHTDNSKADDPNNNAATTGDGSNTTGNNSSSIAKSLFKPKKQLLANSHANNNNTNANSSSNTNKKAGGGTGTIRVTATLRNTIKDLFQSEKVPIAMHVDPQMIFVHTPNPVHQFLLRDYGLQHVVIDFLNANVAATLLPTDLVVDPAHLERVVAIYQHCLLLLRAFVYQNKILIDTEITATLLSTLLRLRHCLTESMDFVLELLRFHPKVVEKIGLGDFCSLVEDVKTAAETAVNRQDNVHGHGQNNLHQALSFMLTKTDFSASYLSKCLALIRLIVLAEVDTSRERLNYFVGVLQEKVPLAADHRLFLHRVLQIGLKFSLEDNNLALMHYDVKAACHHYQRDTGRISFSRLPKDVLADAPMSLEMYTKYKGAMSKWKLLSEQSTLRYHLDIMWTVGSFATYSPDLQGFCQQVFPRMTDVLQLLMIDKYEIRLPYLKFLHGVWFAPLHDVTTYSAVKVFDQDSIMFIRALLATFAQDLRLFTFVYHDDVVRSTKNPDEALGFFPQHIRLLSRYISEAVVPFLLNFIGHNLHIILDTIGILPMEPLLTSAQGIPVHVPTFRTLVDSLVDIVAEITLLDPAMVVHNEKDLYQLDALLHASDLRTGPHRLVAKAENFVAQLEKSAQQAATYGTTFEDPEHGSWRLALRRKCLPEFVLEVDQLAKTNGYTGLEHLLKVDNANHVYVNDREIEIPYVSSGGDVSMIAQSLHVLPIDIIRSPLNAATFRFALKEMSKLIVDVTALQYKEECDRLQSKVHDLRFSVEQELLPNFDRPYSPLGRIARNNPPRSTKDTHDHDNHKSLVSTRAGNGHHAGKQAQNASQMQMMARNRFWMQYSRWSKRGGMLLECIFAHMLYSVDCFRTGQGIERTTITMDDLCHCNAYWINTFTRGLLRSRMDDITARYSDQIELYLDLQAIEEDRRRIIQHVFEDLNAVQLVIKQFAAIESRALKKLRYSSRQLLQSSAMGLGTAINEGGNQRIQTAIIEHIQEEFEHSVTVANGDNFLKVARKKLREYSRIFLTKKGSEKSKSASELRIYAEEVMELLRFFSLLCEGHNGMAQEYLGTNSLVSDIATFVSDLGKVLAAEMRQAMMTEDDLPSKYYPTILGQKRPMVKWVSPLPYTNLSNYHNNNNNNNASGNVSSSGKSNYVLSNPSESNNQHAASSSPVKPLSGMGSGKQPHGTGSVPPASSSSVPLAHPHLHHHHHLQRGSSSLPSMHPTTNNTRNVQYTFIDLDRITLLSRVMTAGLEALSEFCQGPRATIQLIVARAGATKDFATFFKFFGAYHFAGEYTGDIFRSEKQRKDFVQVYADEVRYSITHQSLVALYPKDKVLFHGNCPLASALVVSLANERGRLDHHPGVWHERPMRAMFGLKTRASTTQRLRQATSSFFFFSGSKDATIATWNDDDDADDFDELGVNNSNNNSNNTATNNTNAPFANHHKDQQTLEAQYRRCPLLCTVRGCVTSKQAYIKFRKRNDKEEVEDMESNHYNHIAEFEVDLVAFETSCLKFAMSLLEGSNVEENAEVPRSVVNDIGCANLVCNMANYWQRYLHYTKVVESDADEKDTYERRLAFDYYSLVSRIGDTRLEGIHELIELQRHWTMETRINVDDYIARIEVRYEHEKNLAVTYFPIPKIIKQYWDRGDIVELRDNIIFPSTTGTRDSADEKVKNFIKDGRLLIDTLRHLDSLDETYARKNLLLFVIINVAHNLNRWSNLSFLLAMTLNIIVIMSVKNGDNGTGYHIKDDLYIKLVDDVGLALVCSTGLTFFSYIILYGWLYVKLGLKNNPEHEFSVNHFTISRTLLALNHVGLLGRERAVVNGNTIRVRVWAITAGIYHFFSRGQSWYYIFLLSFAFLGYFITPAMYAVCLMEVLRVSKLMQYVSRAFTENIDQVVATLILAVVILYLFTTVSFASVELHNKYDLNGQGEEGCFSLQSCLRLHLDFGMLNTVHWQVPVEIPTALGEFYNFGLVFIMQIVIPGLISGIIIDTFSEMRGNKQALENDVFNNCFICNIARDDFEAVGIPFERHIKQDHNAWKYIWFLIYLDEKDHTEFDGIEQFCAQQDQESTRWVPIRKARALSNMRERYDLFSLYSKITELQGSLDQLHAGFRAELTAQEKSIREIVQSENADMEKSLRDLEENMVWVRKELNGRRPGQGALSLGALGQALTGFQQLHQQMNHTTTTTHNSNNRSSSMDAERVDEEGSSSGSSSSRSSSHSDSEGDDE